MQLLVFPIRIKDKNKSFNTFYSRFATAIILLGYTNNYKIRDLKRYITLELRDKITNSSRLALYREYIAWLYTYDLEIKQNSALDI